ncbi:MAG: carboxy terminal-processing peptidase [Ferruginibacter sp.]
MQKITDIIMNKRFIPVILGLTVASLFIHFQTQGRNENNDNPRVRYSRILKNVGVLLEEGHFSPKKIDDSFSKEVLKKFISGLDDDKTIFLQSDVASFSKFATQIDDEIHGKELESFFTISEVYTKRFEEISQYYKSILAKPFDFSVNEKVMMDPDKYDFPKNENERYDLWRKRLKYGVLARYTDMLEEREKNKDKKDYVVKADSTLEREARDQVRKQIDRYISTRKNRETLDENFSTFVNAITGLMDPHTDYFPPIDLRSFNESMSGRFYGIGAQLKEDDGKIKIASLVSGGPAWKSGELMENDEIIKVGQGDKEPVDVTGYSVPDAVKLIRGSEKGTEVRLTIRKMDGSTKVITLIRDDIKLEDTYAKSAIIRGQNKIGYIYLPEFYADFERPNGPRCAADVAKEVEKLKAEHVDGIILDLRNNGGGSLYDVVQMAGLFIEDGPICQVKGRDEKANILRDKDKNIQYGGPFAVMVDETSASASEIFAAAIQDYKRGIIIGSTSTYGKGTVQRNIPLNPENESVFSSKKPDDLGTVKLTLQKFYRINGGATQLRGVVPDIILPDRYEYLKFREKDNPNALQWDEINRADYRPWNADNIRDAVINASREDISRNETFNRIRANVAWMDKYNDREYSLQLNKYREDQKKLKAMLKEFDELYKLGKPMEITNLAADTAAINIAQDKIDKNKQWLKNRSSDIFIDETVKVLNRMIGAQNTAKKG